jgi:hypothetical protein
LPTPCQEGDGSSPVAVPSCHNGIVFKDTSQPGGGGVLGVGVSRGSYHSLRPLSDLLQLCSALRADGRAIPGPPAEGTSRSQSWFPEWPAPPFLWRLRTLGAVRLSVPSLSSEASKLFPLTDHRENAQRCHEIGNNNGITVVNFVTRRNLTVKSTMFPHRNISRWEHPQSD